MFVSSASAVQAFKRAGLSINLESTFNSTVLYNPVVDPSHILSAEERVEFRRNLGVKQNEILFMRIGQPGKKWKLWEFEAFKSIKNQVPAARLI